MRRIVRTPLAPRLRRYLDRKQREVDSGRPVDVVWKRARRTRSMAAVYTHLSSMAGSRERCMYCQDSRGVDIDHFWPKADYPERTFVWENLVLACSGCNRPKGRVFGFDAQGIPLLIDPTVTDPWDHLFYDSRTGNVTARFQDDGRPDALGEFTVERSRLPLNIEAVTDGRSIAQRNIERCIDRFEASMAAGGRQLSAETELETCLEDNDQYGLGTWFVTRDGRDEPRFVRMRQAFPETWLRLETRFATDVRCDG